MKRALVLSLLLASSLSAQESKRPGYRFLRQEEDWSAWARAVELADTGDPTDVLKYIPLADDGNVWLSVGGHFRARFESWDAFAFDVPPVNTDDEFVLTRLLLHGDLHLGERDRIFVEGKTAQSTERDLPGGTRTLDVDSLDLQQAFWDHAFSVGSRDDVTLRVGRQMLQFGRQRLVSPLPWGNTLRTWDGVRVDWERDAWKVSSFWTLFAPVDIGDFNEPDEERDFYGVYATRKGEERTLDLYLLGYESPLASFNGTAGEESRYTLGTRLATGAKTEGLTTELEAAYQFGKVGTGDVTAYMLASEVAYRFADVPTRPRLRFGVDVASGDSAPGGGVGTFNQLYPLGHAYFGTLDAVGRQNVIDVSVGSSHALTDRWTAALDLHHFRLASDDDALYNAGGGVFVPGGTSSSSSVGTELDLSTKYRVGRHLTFTAGYGHFFADSVVEDAGGNDTDFLYVGLQYTF